LIGETHVEGARLSTGETIRCDLAVIGVGVIPNAEIAADAGLATQDGVIVDEYTRTEDPNIFAIGDVTRHPSAYLGDAVRLESVHNALEQAKTAAAAICGEATPYRQAPWFWSDQYEFKLQTVGVSAGRYDREVVRGDPGAQSFSVFYTKGRRLIAADSVNAPADHMMTRRLIAADVDIDPEALATADLKSLI
ncbi:MAG: oxidoreductase C-terminal domain-containing protein, partial [Pseudomonadota bacterium]